MRLAAAALVLVLAACGGGSDDEPLTVFAAASLTEVFEELAPGARFNFAGSDELATQLREGARADVYAAASTRYTDELAGEGLLDEPVTFATNHVVLIVPADNPAGLERLQDVAEPGVRLVLAGEGVPAGDYAREGLRAVGLARALDNVVSEEDDVKGVVAKVRLGEADAGFVYETDARAAGGDDVRTLQRLEEPRASYGVAVVRETDQDEEAQAFVAMLASDRGRGVLRSAGFGVP